MSNILDIKYNCFLNTCKPVPLTFLITLTFYADYANGYAIEATNDNGIHVLPMAMVLNMILDMLSMQLDMPVGVQKTMVV